MMIEHAITIEPSQGSVINAYDHMWGYFKNGLLTKKSKVLKN